MLSLFFWQLAENNFYLVGFLWILLSGLLRRWRRFPGGGWRRGGV